MPPTGEAQIVSLSADARNLIAGGQTVHPLGSVTVRQRSVPFDIQISRFQQQPIPAQTWSIASAAISPAIPAALGARTQDSFPPGELLDLTDDEQLSRPAFELWNSGAALTVSDEINSDLTWSIPITKFLWSPASPSSPRLRFRSLASPSSYSSRCMT